MHRLRRLAFVIAVLWIVGCFLSFASGLVLTLIPVSWPWPLPWSDFKDFVETPDGRVLVELRFYNRVLCYDRGGNFVAVHRLPYGSKSTRLAAGRDNLVYLRARNQVTIYSADWVPIAAVQRNPDGERVWELDRESGAPIPAAHRGGETPPDRPVGPGELVFADTPHRGEFGCADGATLRRDGNSLQRVSASGEVIATYATPWPLRPFVFPWPAVLAWPAIMLLYVLGARRPARAATAENT